ncbi:unnamed protein product [Rhizophagus irregularis]|nr:unnamed protein product [Rhizophagus irregularis]
MRSSDLPNQRGKLMDFRAVTSVWKHKAVFDVARLDGEVHVPVYKRVHNPPPEANIYLCFIELRAFGFGIDYISVRILKQKRFHDFRVRILEMSFRCLARNFFLSL